MRQLGTFLYLILIISWYLHLPARIEAFGKIRFDVLTSAFILFCCLTGGRTPAVESQGKIGRFLKILVIYAVLTLPFIEWPGSVVRNGLINFFKAILFYFFTISLVDSERKLRLFVFVFISCQAVRVLEPVYLNITQDYWGSAATMSGFEAMNRLSGAPHDVINPNGLAFVILTVFPFLHYESSLSLFYRLRYWLLLPPMLYALMLTGSRSGLVGMAVIVGMIFLKSQRRIWVGLVIFMGCLVVFSRLSGQLYDRYKSLFDETSRNATTVQGRIQGLKNNLKVAFHRPLFGHGLGTSFEANANYGGFGQISHNLYIEAAQELGFVGLAFFLLFLKYFVRQVLQNLREVKTIPQRAALEALSNAIHVWVVMNLVFSLASYGLSSEEWYMVAGLSIVVSCLISAKNSEGRSFAQDPKRPPLAMWELQKKAALPASGF